MSTVPDVRDKTASSSATAADHHLAVIVTGVKLYNMLNM